MAGAAETADSSTLPVPDEASEREAGLRVKIRDYLHNTGEGRDFIDRILESTATGIVNEAKTVHLADADLAERMETEIKGNVMSSDVFERRLKDYSDTHLVDESNPTYASLVRAKVDETVKSIAPYGICYIVVDTLTGRPYAHDDDEFHCAPPVTYGALKIERAASKEDLEADTGRDTVVLYAQGEANDNASTATPSAIEYKYLTVNVKNNTASNLSVHCKTAMRANPSIKNMVFAEDTTTDFAAANGGRFVCKVAVPVPGNTSEQAKADAVVSVFVSRKD